MERARRVRTEEGAGHFESWRYARFMAVEDGGEGGDGREMPRAKLGGRGLYVYGRKCQEDGRCRAKLGQAHRRELQEKKAASLCLEDK